MNKHAYMIIAHNDVGNLEKLVHALDAEYHDIFVHFDTAQYNNYSLSGLHTKRARLFIYSEIEVHWGSYSMVECELFLLKKATQTEHSYYHLLSGADYLLKPSIEIYRFFEASGKEFVHFSRASLDVHCEEWFDYRHIGAEHFRRSKSRVMNKIVFLTDLFCVKIQKAVGLCVPRCFTQYQKGSQWFSITSGFAKYILKNQSAIEQNFRYSMTPDEIVVQTLAMSSEWKNKLYDYSNFNSPKQNMRLIDWERGKPYTFQKEDYDQLANSPYPFARKFSTTVDAEIVPMLEQKNAISDQSQ